MDKYFTNILIFFIILFILMGLLFYTKATKEYFFNDNSDTVPPGLIFVILDGKSSDYNGWNIYTNQIPDTCVGECPNYLINSTNTCSVNTQPDGNLVIYNADGAVWSSNTQGKGTPPYRTVMQEDSNYVLYDPYRPIWASYRGGSKGTPPYKLVIQSDCNLVIYDKNYAALWSSGTQGKASRALSVKGNNNWTQIPGRLTSVTMTSDGNIFGTDSEFKVYYKKSYDRQFTQIPGTLQTIDTDSKFVCGITDKNNIACASINDALNGQWKIIGKDAKSVSVSNNSVYAVNLDNSLSYLSNLNNLTNVKWGSVPITRIQFHSVSLDNGVLVGINNKNELMYADNNIFSSNPNFTKIQVLADMKDFINISLYNKSILVTDTEGNLWYTPDYKNTNWMKMKVKLKAFMAVAIKQNSA